MNGVSAKIYNLGTKDGQWLGEAVLLSDGMFSAVTDYGNFAYAWRSFGDNFEDFILRINPEYFAGKLVSGIAYTVYPTKKIEASFSRAAAVILPALQAAIIKSREDSNAKE